MGTMQLREAKAKLSKLVEAAERGEATVITKHGRPAAKIVPIDDVAAKPPSPYAGMSLAELLLSMPEDLLPDRDEPPARVPEL